MVAGSTDLFDPFWTGALNLSGHACMRDGSVVSTKNESDRYAETHDEIRVHSGRREEDLSASDRAERERSRRAHAASKRAAYCSGGI